MDAPHVHPLAQKVRFQRVRRPLGASFRTTSSDYVQAFSFGAVLIRSYAICRRHWPPLLLLTLSAFVPLVLINDVALSRAATSLHAVVQQMVPNVTGLPLDVIGPEVTVEAYGLPEVSLLWVLFMCLLGFLAACLSSLAIPVVAAVTACDYVGRMAEVADVGRIIRRGAAKVLVTSLAAVMVVGAEATIGFHIFLPTISALDDIHAGSPPLTQASVNSSSGHLAAQGIVGTIPDAVGTVQETVGPIQGTVGTFAPTGASHTPPPLGPLTPPLSSVAATAASSSALAAAATAPHSLDTSPLLLFLLLLAILEAMLFLGGAVFLLVSLSLVGQVAATEGLWGVAALGRSLRLSRGSRTTMLGLVLLLGFGSWQLQLLDRISWALAWHGPLAAVLFGALFVSSTLTSALLSAYSVVVMNVVYFGCRKRCDDRFDQSLLLAFLEGDPATSAPECVELTPASHEDESRDPP